MMDVESWLPQWAAICWAFSTSTWAWRIEA